ncbi:hypothetical protein GALMADRAFT_226203 [Galerina marginata CBS 339.88]|uniref:Uncharacterized protein n=1 Tax=Galerina marginata (strain CBS 339.88) TaxID=685588 RepID=A0A067SXG3_GALM3|nr:hypothetical protein GALMADRAFT_226203 [Galerina marginata CBS 339.88]
MRAACDIYEHPALSYSEVWAKDAYNRSGKTRLLASVVVFSVALLSTVAACQYIGIVDVTTWHSSFLLRPVL